MKPPGRPAARPGCRDLRAPERRQGGQRRHAGTPPRPRGAAVRSRRRRRPRRAGARPAARRRRRPERRAPAPRRRHLGGDGHGAARRQAAHRGREPGEPRLDAADIDAIERGIADADAGCGAGGRLRDHAARRLARGVSRGTPARPARGDRPVAARRGGPGRPEPGRRADPQRERGAHAHRHQGQRTGCDPRCGSCAGAARGAAGAASSSTTAAACCSAKSAWQQRAAPVDVVDTTGAGDAFTAAFAVALLEEQPPLQSAAFAVAASELAASGYGAQPAYPDREQLEAQLRCRPARRSLTRWGH